jgi:hypothetical protein
MLIDLGVNDVDERLVTVQETMPAGQDVTFQPTLDSVLAEHLHYPAFVGSVSSLQVLFEVRTSPHLPPSFIDGIEHARSRLIRSKDTEVRYVGAYYFY